MSNHGTPSLTSSLMMTSQVLVEGPGGKQVVARVLLDSGSSLSLVSNRIAQTLRLPRTSTKVSFSGAQATPLQSAQFVTAMTLLPMTSKPVAVNVTAAIVPKVTCDLPLHHVRDMPHIKALNLADPTFHLPGKVDLILGCDVMPNIMLPNIMLPDHITGPENVPMTLKTVFRWTVLGKYSYTIS